MTFTAIGRCPRTGRLGVATTTSEMAIGSRAPHVAGNIGAGKSSLTRLLSERTGWKAFFESVEDNPYLGDFYADMKRW